MFYKVGPEYTKPILVFLCLTFIDNMLRFESYSDVITTQDFYFTCEINDFYYILNCDSYVLTNSYFTYKYEALGHKSTIGH